MVRSTDDGEDLFKRFAYRLDEVNPASYEHSLKRFGERMSLFTDSLKDITDGMKEDEIDVLKSLTMSLVDLGDVEKEGGMDRFLESVNQLRKQLPDIMKELEEELGEFSAEDKKRIIRERISLKREVEEYEEREMVDAYTLVSSGDVPIHEGSIPKEERIVKKQRTRLQLSTGITQEMKDNMLELKEEKESILASSTYNIDNKSDRKNFETKMKKLVEDPKITAREFKQRVKEEKRRLRTGLFLKEKTFGRRGVGLRGLRASFAESEVGEAMSKAAEDAQTSARSDVTSFFASKVTSTLAGGAINKLLLLIPGIGPILSVGYTVISTALSGVISLGKVLFSAIGKAFEVLGKIFSTIIKVGTSLLKSMVKWGFTALIGWAILHKTGLHTMLLPFLKDLLKTVIPIVTELLTGAVRILNEALVAAGDGLEELLRGGIYEIPKKITDFFREIFDQNSQGFTDLTNQLSNFGSNLVRVGGLLLDALYQLGLAIKDYFVDILWPLYLKPAFLLS